MHHRLAAVAERAVFLDLGQMPPAAAAFLHLRADYLDAVTLVTAQKIVFRVVSNNASSVLSDRANNRVINVNSS